MIRLSLKMNHDCSKRLEPAVILHNCNLAILRTKQRSMGTNCNQRQRINSQPIPRKEEVRFHMADSVT